MTKTELLKVIRAHCIDCCCNQPYEVERCGCNTCNLYPYRMGKDPFKKELSPTQMEKIRKMHLAKELKKQKQEDTGDAV